MTHHSYSALTKALRNVLEVLIEDEAARYPDLALTSAEREAVIGLTRDLEEQRPETAPHHHG